MRHLLSVRGYIASAILFAATTSITVAADGVEIEINLEQAIKQSLENSKRRLITQQSIEIAEARYQQALTGFRPTFDLMGSLNRRDQAMVFDYPAMSFQIPTPVGSIPVSTQPQRIDSIGREYYGVGIQGRLPLYTGGLRKSLKSQADTGRSIAQQELQRTDLQIAYDTSRYYLGALMAREYTSLLQETADSLESINNITKAFFEGGSNSVDKSDFLQSTLAVDTARVLLTRLEHGYESAVVALTHSVGYDYGDRIEPAQKDTIKAHRAPAADLDALIARAKDTNPDIDVMRLLVELADARQDQARSQSKPNIALTGNVTRFDSNIDTGITNATNRNSWTVGLAFSMPLFDGGLAKAATDEAAAELKKAEISAKMVSDGIATQVRAFVLDLDRSLQELKITERATLSSDENYELLNRAYRSGFKELDDVLNAQFLRTMSHMNLIQAQHQNAMAMLELMNIVGRK